MKRTAEPFWWLLFSTGGTVAAFFVPVFLFFTGVALPLGWIEPPAYERVAALVRLPLSRLFLFAVISLSLFHWGHRFRFTLYDGLQLKHLNQLIAFLCYGGAGLGTAAAMWILWRL